MRMKVLFGITTLLLLVVAMAVPALAGSSPGDGYAVPMFAEMPKISPMVDVAAIVAPQMEYFKVGLIHDATISATFDAGKHYFGKGSTVVKGGVQAFSLCKRLKTDFFHPMKDPGRSYKMAHISV